MSTFRGRRANVIMLTDKGVRRIRLTAYPDLYARLRRIKRDLDKTPVIMVWEDLRQVDIEISTVDYTSKDHDQAY